MSANAPSEDKQKFLRIIEKLLDSEHELDFLLKLEESELQRLVVAVRGRIDRGR